MAIHVVNEARRCLHCKKPMCREGCPISTNIPEAIELFRTGHKEEAGEMLYENNPLSVICSLVCDHEKQCEGHCVLGRKGAPVHFSSIENYISDAYLDHLEPEMEPKKGQRVATPRPVTPQELAADFDWAKVPKNDIVLPENMF